MNNETIDNITQPCLSLPPHQLQTGFNEWMLIFLVGGILLLAVTLLHVKTCYHFITRL